MTHRHAANLRVFILGAGVSASCGIPVAKDIFRISMLRLSDKDSGQAEKVHRLLKYLYPSFSKSLRTYPNIEDFLNLLEMARKFNTEDFMRSTLWGKQELTDVRRITLNGVTDYLWEFMQQKERLQVIRDYASEAVSLGDVIITFNWDVTIEHALHLHPAEPNFDYSYSKDRKRDQIFLLKPHGSIDWFRKKDLPKGTHEKDVLSLDDTLCVFPFFDFRKNPELSKRRPVIVPPVSTKEFKFPFLKKTWVSVYRALAHAIDLKIIGYSLPQEDQFARLVLRRAIRSNILKAKRGEKKPLAVSVINPDPNVSVTFSQLIGPASEGVSAISFQQARFEDLAAAVLSHGQ